MIFLKPAAVIPILFASALLAAPPAPPQLTGFPFTDETLNYSVNWPSGLSLGEGHLIAKRRNGGWSFQLSLDAGIPGYPVKDSYLSQSSNDFCSAEFERTSEHGSRKTDEDETVDTQRSTVKRVTLKGGGDSTFAVPSCVRDALAFLYFTRRELGQGRVPPAQQILFGNLYQTRLDYAGAQVVPVSGKGVETDKIVATMKGPSSELKFEMYFARDAARTPLLIKAKLAVGPFSMELVR
jgi:hypothetical protein